MMDVSFIDAILLAARLVIEKHHTTGVDNNV